MVCVLLLQMLWLLVVCHPNWQFCPVNALINFTLMDRIEKKDTPCVHVSSAKAC